MANETLKQEIQSALDNATLGRTLGNFCKTYPARRINSYAGVDFEATRAGIKEVKGYAADHVDQMIEEFTANCTARGGVVFHAQQNDGGARLGGGKSVGIFDGNIVFSEYLSLAFIF